MVPVFAAQFAVSLGRELRDFVRRDLHDGDVERPASEIVNGDDLLLFEAVQAISQCGRHRFVERADDFQARNFARLLRGPTAFFVEVSRDRDHGFFDIADLVGGLFDEMAKNDRGNAFGRVLVAAVLPPPGVAHVHLDELGDVLGFDLGVFQCRLANKDFVFIKIDHARDD